jgi:YggT family protein
MTTVLAITRTDIGNYVYTLALVYVVIIFIRILLTWFRLPYSRPLNIFTEWISNVTDPYLRMWRRVLPMVRLGPAAMDLSPIIGTIVLLIVAGIVANVISG